MHIKRRTERLSHLPLEMSFPQSQHAFLLLHLCLFPFYLIVSDKSSPPQKTVNPMGKETVIYLISISGCRQAQHIFFKAKNKAHGTVIRKEHSTEPVYFISG